MAIGFIHGHPLRYLARVSMDEQESGNQLAELRQLAATRGFEVTAEYVLDGASAWKGRTARATVPRPRQCPARRIRRAIGLGTSDL
jgi:hypothetical protein